MIKGPKNQKWRCWMMLACFFSISALVPCIFVFLVYIYIYLYPVCSKVVVLCVGIFAWSNGSRTCNNLGALQGKSTLDLDSAIRTRSQQLIEAWPGVLITQISHDLWLIFQGYNGI
jgi:hypothetical protein